MALPPPAAVIPSHVKPSEHSMAVPFLWRDPGKARQAGDMGNPRGQDREV